MSGSSSPSSLEVFTSRSGAPSVRIGGVAVHSPYDPVREARRFVEGSLGIEPPSSVVILGEGLGYLAGCVASAYPSARLLRIHYSTGVYRESLLPSVAAKVGAPGSDVSGDAWHPGLDTGIAEFLRERIGELDLEGLRVLEWPPSAKLFPEQSRAANEALHQVLREANGSLVTTMAVGRLWLRNSISNFLSLEDALQGAPCAPERTLVIAASGPSLEQAAPLLREVRDAVDIWALPSSALFLREAGLNPDLIIMTDPGFYAIHHLHHAEPVCPVAMPLSAARGLWRVSVSAFLLSQPGLLEDELLRALGLAAPIIEPHGTVAATALDLARASTSGPVIFAGLDLCTNDLVSHARPNEFERLFQLQCTRVAPCDSLWYRRSADQNAALIPGSRRARAPLSLRTYAGWLGKDSSGTHGSAYRLLPSVVALPGIKPLDAATFRELVRRSPVVPPGPRFAPHSRFPSRGERIAVVQRIFAGWRGSLIAGLEEAKGRQSYRVLASAPLFTLAYQISTQRLLETKRRARLGDEKGARESAVALLEESGKLLRVLEQRVLNAP